MRTLEIGPYGSEERFDAERYETIRFVLDREVGQRVWEVQVTEAGDLSVRVTDRGGHGSEGVLISPVSSNWIIVSARKLGELPRQG